MTSWFPINSTSDNFYEVVGYTPEPFEIYSSRYVSPPAPPQFIDASRYVKEALCGVSGSLLIFGAGHSCHTNIFMETLPDLTEVCAVDYIKESAVGLNKSIRFEQLDILVDELPGTYDYVFSSHTLEHFAADVLFNVVWPKLERCAKKAIITIVPYGDAWKDEPSHKCRFYEGDKFAAMQSKYKRILDGQELVFWKDMK